MSNYKLLDIKIEVQCASMLSILQEHRGYTYCPSCEELIKDAFKFIKVRGMKKENLTSLEIIATYETKILNSLHHKFHCYWNLNSKYGIDEISDKSLWLVSTDKSLWLSRAEYNDSLVKRTISKEIVGSCFEEK